MMSTDGDVEPQQPDRGKVIHREPPERKHGKPGAYSLASIIVVAEAIVSTHQACIATVLSDTDYPSYELLVLDDETDIERTTWLGSLVDQHHQLRVFQVDAGSSRGARINRGLAEARGQIVVFLADDTIVAQGWLTRLSNHLADSTVGLVGPGTNRSSSEAMIDIAYDDEEGFSQFVRQQAIEHDGARTPVRVVPFFCAASRRDVVERVGPLDDRYQGARFQAEDYALRLKAAGYSLGWARDVFVHRAGTTLGTEPDPTAISVLAGDQRRFEAKWGVRWEADRPPPTPDRSPSCAPGREPRSRSLPATNSSCPGGLWRRLGSAPLMPSSTAPEENASHTACHPAEQISRSLIQTTRIISRADSRAPWQLRVSRRVGIRLSSASPRSTTGRLTLSFPLQSTLPP